MAPDGTFVAVWSSRNQDGNGYGVFGAQFDPNGQVISADIPINLTTQGDQIDPSVALAGARAVVGWSGAGPAGSDGVFLRQATLTTQGFLVAPSSGLVTSEASGQASFTVRLTSAPSASVIIPLSVSEPNTAVLSVASLVFTPANWTVAQSVTVTGQRDGIVTPDKAYEIVLGNAVSSDPGYSGAKPPNVSLTNTNVDTTNTLVVDTDSDVADGDTSSVAALLANRGSDAHISLREAILAENATVNGVGGPDRIQFAIPGTGVHQIGLIAALPIITDAINIDGYTQAGAQPNTLTVGQDAQFTIALDGARAGAFVDGLSLAANASTITGLAITGFSDNGIVLDGSRNQIVGNRIGVLADGMTAAANGLDGIRVTGPNNQIGGLAPG